MQLHAISYRKAAEPSHTAGPAAATPATAAALCGHAAECRTTRCRVATPVYLMSPRPIVISSGSPLEAAIRFVLPHPGHGFLETIPLPSTYLLWLRNVAPHAQVSVLSGNLSNVVQSIFVVIVSLQ